MSHHPTNTKPRHRIGQLSGAAVLGGCLFQRPHATDYGAPGPAALQRARGPLSIRVGALQQVGLAASSFAFWRRNFYPYAAQRLISALPLMILPVYAADFLFMTLVSGQFPLSGEKLARRLPMLPTYPSSFLILFGCLPRCQIFPSDAPVRVEDLDFEAFGPEAHS